MAESDNRPDLLSRLADGWRRHPVLWTLFPAALALTLFFLVQGALHAMYWSDPAHRDEQIAGWMTPGYVAHSWHVPRDVMIAAIGAGDPGKGERPTLDSIARDQGISTDELIARITAAITDHRATAGPAQP
ncbi:hypothetical protein [Pseudoruegeria sp. HB172150]|uniref:hypothetical protein n=1 Tax=Pseudoruegeria sp. HB172150 TaxID=2721164 RepID=UPI0015540E37|nr:hypothetical protein [Pseudoruegeria sp. HB172150]